MSQCNPFIEEKLWYRSTHDLLQVDVPYALQSKQLKLLRPVMNVLCNRCSKLDIQHLHPIIDAHFASSKPLSDKKWLSILTELSDYQHSQPSVIDMWLRHPSATKILTNNHDVVSGLFPYFLKNNDQWINDFLSNTTMSERDQIFKTQKDQLMMWAYDAAVAMKLGHEVYADILFKKAQIFHPQYVIDEIKNHCLAAYQQKQVLRQMEGILSAMQIAGVAKSVLDLDKINPTFIQMCMKYVSPHDYDKLIGQLQDEGVLDIALTAPALKPAYENWVLQQHMPDKTSVKKFKI